MTENLKCKPCPRCDADNWYDPSIIHYDLEYPFEKAPLVRHCTFCTEIIK